MRPAGASVLRLLQLALATTAGKTLLVSALLYGLVFGLCKIRYWRDPHSAFFDDTTVYDLRYSLIREHEALQYISAYNAEQDPPQTPGSHTNTNGTGTQTQTQTQTHAPVICAAVGTIKRDGANYLDASVGSLLEGLHPRERAALLLHVFFADTEPARHPSWGQYWLDRLADEVYTYNVTEKEMGQLKDLEEGGHFGEKGIFDYLYMLDRCYHTQTPYIAIFEDDIILADGWLANSLLGLSTLETKWKDWLYLRLFYTETFLSWENEEDFWYRNMPVAFLLAMSSVGGLLILIRRMQPAWQRHLDPLTMAVVCLITVPAFTGLVFMMGKYNLRPMDGVVEMNSHGCCSQGMIFPRDQIPGLTRFLAEHAHGPTDSMIEAYADEEELARYAFAPPQLQHVGSHSSRHMSELETRSVWAFWFEANDPKQLRRQHDRLLQDNTIPWI